MSNFIVQALRGEPITIYGDGTQTRSFCYVDDLIDGMHPADGERAGRFTGPVNLGNPEEVHDAGAGATMIIRLTGSRSAIEFSPLPADDPARRQPDIRLAAQVLDWRPTIALEEGLQRTILFFDRLLKTT